MKGIKHILKVGILLLYIKIYFMQYLIQLIFVRQRVIVYALVSNNLLYVNIFLLHFTVFTM